MAIIIQITNLGVRSETGQKVCDETDMDGNEAELWGGAQHSLGVMLLVVVMVLLLMLLDTHVAVAYGKY